MKKLYSIISLVMVVLVVPVVGWGQNASATWGANANSAWYTASNWAGGVYAGEQGVPTSNSNIATFTSSFTGLTVGINMTANSLNLGAVSIDNTRTTVTNIGNSGATAGVLRLYGTTVNGVANVIIRNNGSGIFNLQAAQNGTMQMVLSNATDNTINIDNAGGVTISSMIIGAGKLTKAGAGSGILTLSGVNTYSGVTTITSGTLACGVVNAIPTAGGGVNLNGGTFSSGGFTQGSMGTLTLSDNSTIALGTGSHSLNFAASSGVTWIAAKKLTITGWMGTVGTSGTEGKVFVGSSATGLTSSQLSQIQFSGYALGAVTQLSTGEIVPAVACSAPAVQATAISFSTVGTTTMNISWTVGDGAGRIVKINTSNSFTTPTNGTSYTGNLVYGGGEQVIYSGTGSGPVSVTNLTPGTSYWFRVYEYCAAGYTYQTSTATGNPNNQATVAPTPAVIISNTGTPVAGNISSGNSNTVLSAFNIDANTSNDFTAVTITKTGTTTTTDLSNVRIFYDANANSVIDGAEASVSGIGVALANSMGFTIIGQTGFTGIRRYLVVADVAFAATVGRTVTTSVAAFTDVTTSITNKSGTSIGNKQTVVNITAIGDYFRSNVTTGDWAAAGSWESSHNNSVWFTATAPPTSSANTITIQATHTINVSTSISLDQTLIYGTMELQNGGVLNINDGSGDDITINSNGVLRVTNTSNYATGVVPGISQINILTGGKITIGDGTPSIGANYEGFATNTNNIWNNGAVYEYNSLATFGTSGLIYFPNAAPGVIPIFRVTKVSGTPGTGSATTINGLLEVNSSFTYVGGGQKIFRDGIIGTANLTLDGSLGTTTISGVGAILGGSLTVTLNRTLNLSNGIIVPLGANVLINGMSNITKNAGSFLVHGTIDITDRTVSNVGGTVVINGTLKTSHTSGFYNPGNIAASTGTISLNSGSTIEYNGTANQSITGTLVLGQSYYNLIFSGAGIKMPLNAIDVNTLGSVKITGTNTIVDATSNNIGLTTANATNFVMDAGRLRLGTGATLPLMDGAYTITGGVVEYASLSTQTIRNKSYQNIEVTGTNVANSNGNITLNSNGTFIVKTGGVFTINDNTITGPTGTQTVTVETGGLFKTGNNEGFSGFVATFSDNSSLHQNIENLILQTGSTVEYSRSNPPLTNGIQNISNTVPYYHLTLSGTGIKTAPTSTLTVQGNLVKSGTSTFNANGGTVLLNGTTQSFAGLNYNNLWIDNDGVKTLAGNGTILDSLRLGNLTTDPVTTLAIADNFLTLKSIASITARVSTVAPAATITYGTTGRFVVERYYPPRRAWRLVTAPVTADAGRTIFNSWQKGGVTPTSLEGTFVSGPLAPAGGLDVSPLGNYSLQLYNSTGLYGLADTKVPISGVNGTPGTPDNYGMFLFVRGDRSTNSLFYPPFANITTLRDTGKIQIHNQTFNLSGGAVNNFRLVGNPFASTVEFADVLATSTNINKSLFYEYDPYLNTSQGGYLTFTFNGTTSKYDPTPPSPTGKFTSILQSSQAVYVQQTAPNSTLVFTESNKTTAPITALFRPANPTGVFSNFRTNLYLKESDNSTILADGIFVQFQQGNNNGVDIADAPKFTNSKENFGLKRDNLLLAVENRNEIIIEDTLYFNLTKVTARNYQFSFEPKNLDPTLLAFLYDSYTGIKTPVSVTSVSTFDFSVNSDVESSAPDRFRIVFKQVDPGPLPVIFTNINAYEKAKDIAVEWTVQNEINIRQYEVEKSSDGTSFVKMNTTTATGTNSSTTTYSWLDVHPVEGDNYFRIVSVDQNSIRAFSRIVKVKMGKLTAGFAIYPNPVIGNTIGVQFSSMPAGKYKARLLNDLGQVLLIQSIEYAGGNSIQNIIPKNTLAKGIYHLEIINPDKTNTTLKVIK